jgi:hypothetical protein
MIASGFMTKSRVINSTVKLETTPVLSTARVITLSSGLKKLVYQFENWGFSLIGRSVCPNRCPESVDSPEEV